VPLWFMEGMAEHVSHGCDAQGETVLRDAVLHDRLPPLWLMHSFNHLEPHDAYLGYKAGQSALDYLGETYGEDKIPAILKSIDDARLFAQVFADKVGVSLTEFDRRWKDHLKETFWSQVKGKKDAVDSGTGLVVNTPDRTGINTGACQSPTDDTIAFLSDRQGYRNLFLLRKGQSPSAVFSSGFAGNLTGSPPDWSPDGKTLALVVKDGPRNVIALLDVRKRRIRKRLAFPFMDIGHPRFHPDGRSLAFVGFNGKAAEIYLADLETGVWRPVTSDGVADASPAFTPDGTSLVYESETPAGTGLRIAALRPAGLAECRPLGGTQPVEGRRPDVSPDGALLLYDSAESGIMNLYACALDGSGTRRVTDVRTGMFSGRWARDGKRILAVTYENGSDN
ncbi:MAG: hypothetical protein AAB368_17630, partial [bacterium]